MRHLRCSHGLFVLFLTVLATFSSCKKDLQNRNAVPLPEAGAQSIPPGYIMTPAGLMKTENVHKIDPGFSVLIDGGHFYKVRKETREKVEDYGAFQPEQATSNGGKLKMVTSGGGSNLGSGQGDLPSGGLDGGNWVTYSDWSSASPIMYFSTNYVVPPAPGFNSGQLVYIWSGISPASTALPLIQPVLQWGSNGYFGGQYYSLTNWCIVDATHAVYMPAATSVAAGTSLQAIVNCTGRQTDGSYNYTSSYAGYTSQTLTIVEGATYTQAGGGFANYPFIAGNLTHVYEVLEVPQRVSSRTQYPRQVYMPMTNITVKTGTTPATATNPTLAWTGISTPGATLGETTQIISNNSTGSGQVNLVFNGQTAPTIGGTINYNSSVTSGSGTIYGSPGATVTVKVTAYNVAGFYAMTCTLSGATFDGGGGPASVSGNTTASSISYSRTFTVPIPGNGQVSFTGNFYSASSSAYGSISVQ